MELQNQPLWLQTLLCLLGCVVGFGLHVKWHPLRGHMVDAWRFVKAKPWLTGVVVMGPGLYEWLKPTWQGEWWANHELSDWSGIAEPLGLRATETFVQLLYGVLPPWPLAMVLPLLMTHLAWQVSSVGSASASGGNGKRRTRKRAAGGQFGRVMLWLGVLLSWCWVGLEVMMVSDVAVKGAEMVLPWCRVMGSAVMMALGQIFVVRLVCGWGDTRTRRRGSPTGDAWKQTCERWRSLPCLVGINLLWLMWVLLAPGHDLPNEVRLLVAMVFLMLAPLPVVVGALAEGEISALPMGQSLTVLLHVSWRWLGLIATSVVCLALVLYADAVFREMEGSRSTMGLALLPLHVLVLATVRNWLFLTSVFLFLRHGLHLATAVPRTEEG